MEENQQTISKIYAYHALKVDKARHLFYEDRCQAHNITIEAPNALVGIEVEVENIVDYYNLEYYWEGKSDGSLRNSGAEFTSIPLRGQQIPYALRYLKEALEINNKPDFSNRTSVHVHMNVRDMTWNQIKTFILLYAIFERHFFNIAGTKREESIFCVPLYKTNQVRNITYLENGGAENWYKYSAINCGTILGNDTVPKFGTIEFRHLYGTLDEKIIINWINNIFCLRNASAKIKYEDLLEQVKNMNTTSEYVTLYQQVFKEYANTRTMLKKDFEYCVTQTKLSLWGDIVRYSYNANSNLWKRKNITKEKQEINEMKAKIIKDLINNAQAYHTPTFKIKHAETFDEWFNDQPQTQEGV
jgi:hypothetical protein